jgi:hypothetical protein
VRCVLATTALPQPNGQDQPPQRLFEYLQGVQSKDATLIITGHSLGGALSPILALALFTQGGPLQKENWGQVYVLPIAGATPGNADLAAAFAAVFPAIPEQVPSTPNLAAEPLWNCNIANKFDFVPLAWVPSELEKVKPPPFTKGGIYPQITWESAETRTTVRAGIDIAVTKANAGAASIPYGSTTPAGAYTALPTVTFNCTEIDPTATIRALADYINHWLLQHVDAYIEQIFKVEDLMSPEKTRAALRGAGAGLLAAAYSAEVAARAVGTE